MARGVSLSLFLFLLSFCFNVNVFVATVIAQLHPEDICDCFLSPHFLLHIVLPLGPFFTSKPFAKLIHSFYIYFYSPSHPTLSLSLIFCHVTHTFTHIFLSYFLSYWRTQTQFFFSRLAHTHTHTHALFKWNEQHIQILEGDLMMQYWRVNLKLSDSRATHYFVWWLH